jgi:hypothetical protein
MRRKSIRYASLKATATSASVPVAAAGSGMAPMRGHRLTRPHRASFASGIVADCKNEVESGCARRRELAPRFRTKTRGVIIDSSQQSNRFRVNAALWLAAGTVGAKPFCTELVQDGFRHDRARRVARAEKQHIEGTIRHELASSFSPVCNMPSQARGYRCQDDLRSNPSLGTRSAYARCRSWPCR